MSTHVPSRGARAPRNRPWPTATVPQPLLTRLHDLPDPREQLAAVAMHHFDDLTRQIAWQVGDVTAQDLVQDVIVRHLARHDRDPQPDYAEVAPYHRLRASLIASARYAAIDHLRTDAGHGDVLMPDARSRADQAFPDEGHEPRLLDADAAALHDGLRRIDGRRARVVRMRLTGATFEEIADHLDVSLSTAYKVYQKALRDVYPVLQRYVRGEYCSEYGPFLMLACDSRDADPHEHPLAAVVGADRAHTIMSHVFGDPDIPADDGCPLCQRAATQFGAVLVEYLPMPLLLIPASGIVAVLKAALTSAWGALTGTAAVKGTAIVAASALTIGGTLSVTNRNGSPSPGPVPAVTAPQSTVVPQLPNRPAASTQTRPKPRTKPKPRATPSPSAEFAPAASPPARSAAPRPGSGTAAGEFSP